MDRPPRIVVTVQSPGHAANEDVAWQKNDRYFEAVARHGGDVVVLDEDSTAADREAAFATMDGLLLSGGADLAPSLYGEEPHPSTVVEPERDALEQAAFTAAEAQDVPIFGVCRGMQAINVFRGGALVQDIEGHTSPAYPAPEAKAHDMEIEAGTRLAELLGETIASVNTYHHQAVRADQVGSGLTISGYSAHPEGDLVEALEDANPNRVHVPGVRAVVGVVRRRGTGARRRPPQRRSVGQDRIRSPFGSKSGSAMTDPPTHSPKISTSTR
jgi:putative glutamine amidotransferase